MNPIPTTHDIERAKARSQLFVECVPLSGTPHERSGMPRGFLSPISGPAWRVCVPLSCGDIGQTLMAFGRRKDADAAKAALERAGAVDEETLLAIPFDERNRIMAEAMAW